MQFRSWDLISSYSNSLQDTAVNYLNEGFIADCDIPSHPSNSFFILQLKGFYYLPRFTIMCTLFCLSFKALSVPTLSFKVCFLLLFKLPLPEQSGHEIFIHLFNK